MLRGKPLAGFTLALAVLALVYGGVRSLDSIRRTRVAESAARSAEEGARAARDTLALQLESVKMMGHNAVMNPRLVMVLRGRVDAETLRDAFSSESWWEPYRSARVAVSYEGDQIAFQQEDGPDRSDLPFPQVIQAARENGTAATRLAAAGGKVWAMAAIPIPVGGSEPTVLVLSKSIEAPVLTTLGARPPGPLLFSDGRRSLGGWGPGRDLRLLESLIGRERGGTVTLPDMAWGAAAQETTPGLWLWSGSRVVELAAAQIEETIFRQRVLWIAGGLTALLLVLLSLRPRRVVGLQPVTGGDRSPAVVSLTPAPSTSPVPQTVGETESRAAGVGIPLGRYVLLDRIGEGGMAEVFTAVSFGSGGFHRTFVVKRLRAEMAANPMAVAHFIDEANLASRLVHPNIVPVFDFGQVAGAYFLAQEYVVGRDLGRLIRRMAERNIPRLSVSAALYVTHEMARGLHHAHEKRADDGSPLELVHRDVTPENVMISEHGEVKILDFGIVKAVQRVSQTDIGTVKGNVDYMSPEQARGRTVDRRSDVFSAGLVLYFALTRTPLYRGDTLYDRLMRAAMGPGPEEQERIWALPAPLPEILRGALAIDPEARFQTANELALAVAPYIEGGPAEVAGALELVFADELQLEQDRLAAAFPRGPARSLADEP